MYKCLVSMCASSIFKYCLYAYICYVFFIYVISKCSHSRVLHQVNTKCNNFFLYLFIFFCRCCVCVHAVLRYVLRLCMLSYNTKKKTLFFRSQILCGYFTVNCFRCCCCCHCYYSVFFICHYDCMIVTRWN